MCIIQKKCPYCEGPMKEGRVETEATTGLFWIPRGESLGWDFFRTKKSIAKIGGIILDGPYWSKFNMPSATAFYCESCKKIIIEL